MRILSIQSSVAYGHVGNSAAVFPLQLLGHEVIPVPTVVFSNHPGYGSRRGQVMEPALVADLITGIDERGALATVDAVLTGYLGSPGIGEVVLSTVARVRELNPRAAYCCDPVLGDEVPGMYVAPGIPELMADAIVPTADVVTPNVFELAYLAGDGAEVRDGRGRRPVDVSTIPGLLAAIDTLRAIGPSVVLVTSVGPPLAEAGEIALLAADASGVYRVTTPRLPIAINGAGDVAAALFLAHLLSSSIDRALARTASSVFGIVATTADLGRRELALPEARQVIAHPTGEFPVSRLR
jgi:pyridoxine kinase